MRLYAGETTMEETNNQKIIELLRDMRLPEMAAEYERQLGDVSCADLSFEARMSMLVTREHDSRTNHTVEKCIREAKFYDSTADLRDIDYSPERKLDPRLIESLKTNEYINQALNVILVGASGCGKTWTSCALGVNACRGKYRTKYKRLPELFSEFEIGRIQGPEKYQAVLKKYSKYDLLIIDEFLIRSCNETERNDLFELIEARISKKSTIICSQWTLEGWHEKLGAGIIADSILDRIINSSYKIIFAGNSMREKYSRLK